jgi:hypothetical protein
MLGARASIFMSALPKERKKERKTQRERERERKVNELKPTFSELFCLDENVLTTITTRKNTVSTHYHEFYNLTYEKQKLLRQHSSML